MEMTTDMLAPEDVLAPAKQAPTAPALLTINPEEYVTQVFAPFRAKLATLKAEADAIHFDAAAPDAPGTYIDITTTAGMAVAVKYRAAFRDDVRLDIGKTKVAKKAPILQIGRLLDSKYNAIVAEAAPYEDKFDVVIKAEEKRKADIAAEKERVKTERIGAIKAAIEAIRALPDRAAGKSVEELRALLERVAARVITKEEFAEFDGEAQIALDASGEQLVAMYGAAQQAEEAAATAEAARLAEIERIAVERAELAKLRAEADERERVAKAEAARVAAEQAAEAKRLATLAAEQAAELQKLRDAEAARVRAEQAERDRVAAEARRQMEAEQAAMAAERRALDEAKAAAAAADKARAEAAALYQAMADNFDDAFKEYMERAAAEHDAKCAEKQAMVNEAITAGHDQAADERIAGMPVGALGADALADVEITEGPTNEEIIEFGAEHGLDVADLVARLKLFVAEMGVN